MELFQKHYRAYIDARSHLTPEGNETFIQRLGQLTPPPGGMSAADVEHYLRWLMPAFVSVDADGDYGDDPVGRCIQALAEARRVLLETSAEPGWVIPDWEDGPYDGLCAIAWMPAERSSQYSWYLLPHLFLDSAGCAHAIGLAWRMAAEGGSSILQEGVNKLAGMEGEDLFYGCMTFGAMLSRAGESELLEQMFAICRASTDPENRAIPEDFFL